MTTCFLDSSAVVRLYVLEPGERMVREFVRSATRDVPSADVAVCDLAYPEAVAALHRIIAETMRRGGGSARPHSG